jgi:hypothetical protein
MAGQLGPMMMMDCCGCATKKRLKEPASKKGMLRIPQAKIDWILSRRKRRAPHIDEYEALGADPEFMEMIHDMAQAREQPWANMRKLQEWVRREYAAKGYVEVDEDSVELAALPPPNVYTIDEADYED